jgi:hypothetical protein
MGVPVEGLALCALWGGHQLREDAKRKVIDAFARYNIRLHIDTGEMGGGEEIEHDDFLTSAEADTIYDNEFSTHRHGIFYYCIVGCIFEETELLGKRWTADGFLLAGWWLGTSTKKAKVFMHELGHCLGMYDDDDDRTWDPNADGDGFLDDVFTLIFGWGEPYGDVGLDGVPGTGDTGEGNGRYDGEHFWDWGLDGLEGTNDPGEGNGTYDVGEPFSDVGLDGIDDTNDVGEDDGVWNGREPFMDMDGDGHRDMEYNEDDDGDGDFEDYCDDPDCVMRRGAPWVPLEYCDHHLRQMDLRWI